MNVVVVDIAHVQIDGVNVGSVADAFANYKDAPAEILAGLLSYEESLKADIRTANAQAEKAAGDATDLVNKAKADAEAAIEVARAESIAERNVIIEQANANVAAAQQAAAKTQADADEWMKDNQQKFDTVLAANVKTLQDAQAQVQEAQAQAAFASNLQNLHWTTLQHVMAGNSDAALAALKQIQIIEVTGKEKGIVGQKAALGI